MKRLISLLLTVLMLVFLCACESEQERAMREIQDSINAYQDAQGRVDDIQEQIDILEGLLGK